MSELVFRIAEPALKSCGPNSTVLCAAGRPAATSTITTTTAPQMTLLIPDLQSSFQPSCRPSFQPVVAAHPLKHLHASVALIRDVDAVLVVDEQASRKQELSCLRA